MNDPTNNPVLTLLAEHDEITLELSPDGWILVRNPVLGTMEVHDLAAISARLTSPGAWTPHEPGRRYAREAPRGTVIKPTRGEDLYCVWSNNVDNVVAGGTRAEMLAEGVKPSRLARADKYGTSAMWLDSDISPVRDGGWDDEGMVVHNQEGAPSHGCGWLPRVRLAAFIRAALAGDDTTASALLDPITDDEG